MAHSREERWSLEVCDLLWVFGTYWHTRLRSVWYLLPVSFVCGGC